MALPLTRNNTYVASGAPTIKAADLNALQDGVVGDHTATVSKKAVVIDGTGGATVVPVAGTVKVSAAGAHAAEGGNPVASGLAYKEGLCLGWAKVLYDAFGVKTYQRGYNCRSVSRAAGPPIVFTVVFDTTLSNPADCCPNVTSYGTQVGTPYITAVANDGGGRCSVSFSFYDSAGATLNTGFMIQVFGS